METTPLNSFLKFYVMISPEIDLYGIAHMKVDIIPRQNIIILNENRQNRINHYIIE